MLCNICALDCCIAAKSAGMLTSFAMATAACPPGGTCVLGEAAWERGVSCPPAAVAWAGVPEAAVGVAVVRCTVAVLGGVVN
eukprot:626261-Pyramimonas_sp.AAC.1